MAETHLEVYRRFEGTLEEPRFRSLPLWITGLQTALKQRRALLILYLPPVIGTVIFSFMVYVAFSAMQMMEGKSPLDALGGSEGGDLQEQMARSMAIGVVNQGLKMLEVTSQIIHFNEAMSGFALLIVAWLGSGLLCEDRKAGAHQLYFARPITRLDYFLGKFGIAAFFGLCAMLVPALVICAVASFSSPDWSFLREKWDVILRAIAFSLLWTTIFTVLVLLASSLASRRSFAVIGVFGMFMISGVMGKALGHLVDRRLFALSLGDDLQALSAHIFAQDQSHTQVSAGEAWIAMGAVIAVSLLVIAQRVKRLEVVA